MDLKGSNLHFKGLLVSCWYIDTFLSLERVWTFFDVYIVHFLHLYCMLVQFDICEQSLFFFPCSNLRHQFLFDAIPLFPVGSTRDCAKVGAVICATFGERDDMVYFSRVSFFQSQKSSRLVGHAASFSLFGFSVEIPIFFFIVSFCHTLFYGGRIGGRIGGRCVHPPREYWGESHKEKIRRCTKR